MPKTPIDYSKTIIYKICCNDIVIKDCYVGSTNDFDRRKSQHKSRCHNENGKEYNFPIYQFIRSNGHWNNWSMIPVDIFNTCSNKLEKLQRERYYVEQLNATLNSQVPGIHNEMGHKGWCKNYYETHIEHLKEHKNAKNNCFICNGRYTNTCKARHMKSKLHQNCISLKGILNNHNSLITDIDIFINELTIFIESSNNFILGVYT